MLAILMVMGHTSDLSPGVRPAGWVPAAGRCLGEGTVDSLAFVSHEGQLSFSH